MWLWVCGLILIFLSSSVFADIGRVGRLHPSAVYVDQRDNVYIVFGLGNYLRFRVWDNQSSSWIGDAFNYEYKGEPVHWPSFSTARVPYYQWDVTNLYVLWYCGNTYTFDNFTWSVDSSSAVGALESVPTKIRTIPLFGAGDTTAGTLTVRYPTGLPDILTFIYDSRWNHEDLISLYHLYDEENPNKWYKQMLVGRLLDPDLRVIGIQPYGYAARDEEGNAVVWISCVARAPDGTDKVLLVKWNPDERQPLESFLGIKYQKGLKGQEPVGYVYRIADTIYHGYEDCWHSCVKVAPSGSIYWVYTNEKRQLILESFIPYSTRVPQTRGELEEFVEAGLQPFPGWVQTTIEDTEGVRNVALDVDRFTGYAHIAYSVEDGSGNVDYYYVYGGSSVSGGGGGWNQTLLSNDWATPETDYGIAIAVNDKPNIRKAYIPRARFDPSDESWSYMEYAEGAGAMAVIQYQRTVGSVNLTIWGDGVAGVGSNNVYRGELFNCTVKANVPIGRYRLVITRKDPATGAWSLKPENVIRLYPSRIFLSSVGDNVEMLLWHAGDYKIEFQYSFGSGVKWLTPPNGSINVTSIETNKDVYVLPDWGYRADEPCNFSTYWNNITADDWEVIFGKCYPDRGWTDSLPPSAYGYTIFGFRDESVMPLGPNEGQWCAQILGRLMDFYGREGDTWVVVIRRNLTKHPEDSDDWLRKIFSYMYFSIYSGGLSGNLSIPSSCTENSLTTVSAVVSGLGGSRSYDSQAVYVDVKNLDDESVKSRILTIPISDGNGSIKTSFAPAGEWRCVLYAKPTDPDEENYILDVKYLSVSTGSFLGDALLNQRRLLGAALFNGIVAGTILFSMMLIVGIYTQSFTAMGIILLMGGVGLAFVGWLPMWVSFIVVMIGGVAIMRIIRSVVGV